MKRKLSFLFLLITFIGVLTTAMFMTNLLNTDHMKGVYDRLYSNAEILKGYLEHSDAPESQEALTYIKSAARSAKARLTLIDSVGTVLVDSEFDGKQLENHKDRPEFKVALNGGTGTSIRFSDTAQARVYYLAIPVETERGRYALRLSLLMKDLDDFKYLILKQVVISIVAGVVIAELIGYGFIAGFLKPVSELTALSKKIASGSFREKINIHTNDELGELAANFNHMSAELDRKINEIKERNYEMRSIIRSMVNGVIAVDNQKRVMFLNPTAEKLFRFSEEQAAGKHILSILRNSELDDALEALLSSNTTDVLEIELSDPEHKVLKVYTNPLIGFNERLGILIVIEDITEIKRAESMRKDFVANVSHELKTPLTSIKGFVETLKDGAVENPKVRGRFLDIIDMETNRLSTLIEDLLVLSEIESRKSTVEEEFSVLDCADDVMVIMEELANQRGVDLKLEVASEEGFPTLHGNPGWFKQMLINLMDNGMKYRREMAEVTVAMHYDASHIHIDIKDNGIGIPKEHMSRLFERFYRVDKSRSKSIGGTGLGLAIVKHVVSSFEGEISVDSVVDQGTTFHVSLPRVRTFEA